MRSQFGETYATFAHRTSAWCGTFSDRYIKAHKHGILPNEFAVSFLRCCDGESYDLFLLRVLSLRSDPTVSTMEWPVFPTGRARQLGADATRNGAVMKNPYEVLHSKEEMVCQLRRETEALRFLIGLLDTEDGADASPANPPSGPNAVYLLTNSGRLEVVVQGTPRLRFGGQMRMPMEIMRIGNEFHIFLPTPQASCVSSRLVEKGAA